MASQQIDWGKVLPAWFRSLSTTAEPEEYAERTTTLLQRHYNYASKKMLAVARRTAKPKQRKALSNAVNRKANQRPRGKRP